MGKTTTTKAADKAANSHYVERKRKRDPKKPRKNPVTKSIADQAINRPHIPVQKALAAGEMPFGYMPLAIADWWIEESYFDHDIGWHISSPMGVLMMVRMVIDTTRAYSHDESELQFTRDGIRNHAFSIVSRSVNMLAERVLANSTDAERVFQETVAEDPEEEGSIIPTLYQDLCVIIMYIDAVTAKLIQCEEFTESEAFFQGEIAGWCITRIMEKTKIDDYSF